jgi:hypothetical protein
MVARDEHDSSTDIVGQWAGENLERQLIEGLTSFAPGTRSALTSDVSRPWYSACCTSGGSMKPFVTSMTILPDQSCSTAPTSLKATAPTATRMISASTASSTVTALTLAPSSGEFAEDFGAARIGDEDGNGLRGEEAGERRAHQPRAYDGVRHVDLHIDRCRKFSSGPRPTRH